MPNYGDVALALPAEWDRNRLASGQEFMFRAVGHENGVADLCLEKSPEKRHQFQWCDPKDTNRFHYLRGKHYEWVKQAGGEGKWRKNPALWTWNSENFCEFSGEYVMFRDASWFEQEKAEEKRRLAEEAELRRMRRSKLDSEDIVALRKLAKRGVMVTDDDGRELRPMTEA